jgi:hypothetical protein
MRWAGHVARTGKRIDAYKILWGDLMEGRGADEKGIFRWILET